MLSDLRESGSIEQDADIVMFLYRNSYYDKTDPNVHSCECIVAKNRHGEPVWARSVGTASSRASQMRSWCARRGSKRSEWTFWIISGRRLPSTK